MSEKELIKKRCCFTGHRPEKLLVCNAPLYDEQEIKRRLKAAILDAIRDGYETFITGMARGIDMWAADAVIEAKAKFPQVKLVCAIPFEGFEKRWRREEQLHYQRIRAKADYEKIISDHYTIRCFQMRNIYMVDHSSRVIAAYNGQSGGTRNTVLYAKSRGVEVVNVLEDDRMPI